jgi:uncharacterized repeat protein (TIGR03803 family)
MLDRPKEFARAKWFAAAIATSVLLLGSGVLHGGVTVTAIHSFNPTEPNGATLASPLTQGNDGNFYGVAEQGGLYGWGTVYRVTPSGILTTIHSFTLGDDGANPRSQLVLGTNGSFYGITQSGGASNYGTIYSITPGGVLTPLHSFTGLADGQNPLGGLILATDGNFYGTTSGGNTGYGAFYQLTPGGTFRVIRSFQQSSEAGVTLSPLLQGTDGQLYGTTTSGGDLFLNNGYGYGFIYKITLSGIAADLYDFTDANDGETPYGGLVQGLDGNFYGTAIHGTTGYGSVYQMTPSGGIINVLYDFTGQDGAGPTGTLIQGSDSNLYGTTVGGGTNRAGTVFQISTNGAFNSLYSFSNPSGKIVPEVGPFSGVVQGTNGVLYGTTMGGGYGFGTVFSITTNGNFAQLCSFPGGGEDGARPNAALIQDTNGILYGTAGFGGDYGSGTIFKITESGALTPLFSFTGETNGGTPSGSLTLASDGNLYGTTGNYNGLNTNGSPYGTVFQITTNGVLTTLYSFTNGYDGGCPKAGVTEGADGNLYGTTIGTIFGTNAYGTIFRVSPSGSFSVLHMFNGTDGSFCEASLLRASDGNFYGAASEGANSGHGTIFKITTNGAFTLLHEFSTDGSTPEAQLIQGADGNLWGTCSGRDASGYGAIFKITLPNTFSVVYTFTNGIDGANPVGGLVQGSDGNFYGTASAGGLNSNGVIYLLTPSGSFQPLYSFSAVNQAFYNQTGTETNADGVTPLSALVQARSGSFYGVTQYGGQNGAGTIFRMSIVPPPPPEFMGVTAIGATIHFTWSAQSGCLYQVQYCTNLAQPNWINLGAAAPAISTTLAASDTAPVDRQRFYRAIGLP